jgi:hypothetical protein
MDQKPIVLYLRMKGMGLNAIHDDLVRTLGNDAVVYSMVTKYARSVQFSGRKEATLPEAPDVEGSPVDETIFTDLAEFPFPFTFTFSSVRELSRRICLPRSTVHRAPASASASAPHAITSLHNATFSMGLPLLDGGTEADSCSDGNQTIAGPLGANHAPVAQHYHIERIMDLFVQ